MYCPKCGKKNDDNALFCEACGMRLSAAATGKAAQPTGGVRPAGGSAQPTGGMRPAGGSAQPTGGVRPAGGSAQPSGGNMRKPAPVQHKKERRGISLAAKALIAELLLTAALAAVIVLIGNHRFSPETTAESYWKAMAKGSFDEAYGYCDFADSPYLSKEMFAEAMDGREAITYNSYTVSEVTKRELKEQFLSGSEDADSVSKLQKIYQITYTEKGKSERTTDYVILSKTGSRKCLFWEDWKVTNADVMSQYASAAVPNGALVTLNGEALSKDLIESTEYGLDQYEIPQLFNSTYRLEITMEDMEPYRMLWNVADSTFVEITHLEASEEVKEVLAGQVISDTQAIVDAAYGKKPFSAVKNYFCSDFIDANEIEDAYEELEDLAGDGEESGIISFDAEDLEIFYEGCDFTEDGVMLTFTVEGDYEKSERRTSFWSGSSVRESEGSFYMRAKYIKTDTGWKLYDMPVDYYSF